MNMPSKWQHGVSFNGGSGGFPADASADMFMQEQFNYYKIIKDFQKDEKKRRQSVAAEQILYNSE